MKHAGSCLRHCCLTNADAGGLGSVARRAEAGRGWGRGRVWAGAVGVEDVREDDDDGGCLRQCVAS